MVGLWEGGGGGVGGEDSEVEEEFVEDGVDEIGVLGSF